MKFVKKHWALLLFLLVVIYSIINTLLKSITENNTQYNFVITKIDTTETKQLILYNKNLEINLWNFVILENENVKVGDSISKERFSKYLYVMRKDANGKYYEYKKEYFSGMFPYKLLNK